MLITNLPRLPPDIPGLCNSAPVSTTYLLLSLPCTPSYSQTELLSLPDTFGALSLCMLLSVHFPFFKLILPLVNIFHHMLLIKDLEKHRKTQITKSLIRLPRDNLGQQFDTCLSEIFLCSAAKNGQHILDVCCRLCSLTCVVIHICLSPFCILSSLTADTATRVGFHLCSLQGL